MKKIYIAPIILVSVLVGIIIFSKTYLHREQDTNQVLFKDYKNTTYIIDGRPITLNNGLSEIKMTPDSSTKIITRYFGNEVRHDLDNNGREDVVFLLTQEGGGSATFYYVVAALNTPNGFLGSQAFLLGDRIAPQTTEINEGVTTNETNRQNVIVVNYAIRLPDEAFTTKPSHGKSVWLKLDPVTMQFSEVAQNFEGEANNPMTEAEARVIAGRSCIKGGEVLSPGIYNENSKTWWYDANLNASKPGCKPACVVDTETRQAEINWRCTGAIEPIACTMDAKQCQDGSYVGRTGPNCEFVCP